MMAVKYFVICMQYNFTPVGSLSYFPLFVMVEMKKTVQKQDDCVHSEI